jgi:isopenicillin N synthase-like dioxygenase
MATPRAESGEYKNYKAKLVAPNLADAVVRRWVIQLSDFVHQTLAATKRTLFGFANRLEQHEHVFAKLQLANPTLADEVLYGRSLPVRIRSLSQQAQTAPSYGAKRGVFS